MIVTFFWSQHKSFKNPRKVPHKMHTQTELSYNFFPRFLQVYPQTLGWWISLSQRLSGPRTSPLALNGHCHRSSYCSPRASSFSVGVSLLYPLEVIYLTCFGQWNIHRSDLCCFQTIILRISTHYHYIFSLCHSNCKVSDSTRWGNLGPKVKKIIWEQSFLQVTSDGHAVWVKQLQSSGLKSSLS